MSGLDEPLARSPAVLVRQVDANARAGFASEPVAQSGRVTLALERMERVTASEDVRALASRRVLATMRDLSHAPSATTADVSVKLAVLLRELLTHDIAYHPIDGQNAARLALLSGALADLVVLSCQPSASDEG